MFLDDLLSVAEELLWIELEADLLKEDSFRACCEGAKYLFHTASPFVTTGIKDPQAPRLCS